MEINPESDRVILLHGLARTPRSMAKLAQALAREGYAVENWEYPSRQHDYAGLLALLRPRIAALAGDGKTHFTRTHFVGHSLGGLLLRSLLSEPLSFPAGRLVLLGVPNRGALSVARLQARRGFGRLPEIFGRPARDLYRDAPWLAGLPWPKLETGAIAGTRRFHPLIPSAWINLLHGAREDGDGTVEVDSALPPMLRHTLMLPVGHSFLPNDPRVIAAVQRFLRDGRF
ncbi:alpha/beta fold hydrolase [Ferrovibrio sp.]|uniref:esterase/lipase family protein n=1 Tax=Ferrovibrio sp. TaxID=1917215 RepID=UPI002620F8DB|nr:alpha/beta fold hydrolase [Ferrovibrio sp.]